MVVRRRIRAVLIPLVLYGVAGCLVGYFLHNAKIGNRGLDAKQVLKVQIFELSRSLDWFAPLYEADGPARDVYFQRSAISREPVQFHADSAQVNGVRDVHPEYARVGRFVGRPDPVE